MVLRDPLDVLLSFYHFFEDWFFPAGDVSLDEFAHEFWLERGVPTSKMNNASYFVHLTSWYEHRNDPNVLVLCFEDLKENLETEVRRVAEFISTDKVSNCAEPFSVIMYLILTKTLHSYDMMQHDFTKEEMIQGAVKRSSFQFMKAHASHFDEKLSKLARNEACGLPKDAGMNGGKLRSGTSGVAKAKLSPELQAKIRQKWTDVVTPVTGCDTYSQLRESLSTEKR